MRTGQRNKNSPKRFGRGNEDERSREANARNKRVGCRLSAKRVALGKGGGEGEIPAGEGGDGKG